eukprot:11269104-Ditylum_brightwellii.AAC.1
MSHKSPPFKHLHEPLSSSLCSMYQMCLQDEKCNVNIKIPKSSQKLQEALVVKVGRSPRGSKSNK